MGAEQGQQQRDFFFRTDLDHGDLLFVPLVGPNGEGVQEDLVSGLFQTCFARRACPTERRPECPDAVAGHVEVSKSTNVNRRQRT
jgi:hypothetical protein